MSRFQRTRSPFLNFLDTCLTPVSSLKTSLRSDFGRLFIKWTDISMKIYGLRYEIQWARYLSSGHNCTWEVVSALLERSLGSMLTANLDCQWAYQPYRRFDQGWFDSVLGYYKTFLLFLGSSVVVTVSGRISSHCGPKQRCPDCSLTESGTDSHQRRNYISGSVGKYPKRESLWHSLKLGYIRTLSFLFLRFLGPEKP